MRVFAPPQIEQTDYRLGPRTVRREASEAGVSTDRRPALSLSSLEPILTVF